MHIDFTETYYKNYQKKVAMFVANAVTNDSRVIKTAQTIKKLGYDITVYGIGKKNVIVEPVGFNFPIKLLPRPNLYAARNGINIRPEAFSKSDYVNLAAQALYDELVNEKIDILHTHDMVGISIGAKLFELKDSLSCKWVHDIHEYVEGLTDIDEELRNFHHNEEKQHIHKPDVLTTVSPDLAKLLEQAYGLKNSPKIVLNAPRLSDYDSHAPDIRSSLGLSQQDNIYVYVGNLKEVRGVDIIVDILAKKKNFYLVVITNSKNEYVDNLKAKIKSLGLSDNVIFMPYVAFNQVTSFLRTADLGIHPIKRYPNAEIALPNKLFEYMHSGLPVISSNVRTMSDFIANYDCGSSFNVDDVDSLGKSIDEVNNRLSRDKDWRKKIRELRHEFCWEEQEKILRDIYDEVSTLPSENCKSTGVLNDKLNILQLPVAAAGQPYAIAKGLNQIGNAASVMYKSEHNFKYPSDLFFDAPTNQIELENKVRNVFSKYDVIHYHSVPLIWNKKFAQPTGLDLLIAKLLQKKVVYHFRGTEARLKTTFMKSNPYHYVNDEPTMFAKFPEAAQKLFFSYVRKICNSIFVVDPELQTYLPDALIVPRALDFEKFPSIEEIKKKNDNEPIVIVHAPSRRSVKGTTWIIDAIKDLKNSGLEVELKIVENLPNEEALVEYSRADIVIDQLRIGWYGVLSVEAMALGKPVVAYIRDDLKHNLPYPYPLAIANKDNMKSVLLELINDHSLRTQLGIRARQYVKEVHCSDKIAKNLDYLYRSINSSDLAAQEIYNFMYGEKYRSLSTVKKQKSKNTKDIKKANKIYMYAYILRYKFSRLRKYRNKHGFILTLHKIISKINQKLTT